MAFRVPLVCECGIYVNSLSFGFAGEDRHIGVAISRFARMMVTAVDRLESSGIRLWLDGKKLAEALTVANEILPHFKAVACLC